MDSPASRRKEMLLWFAGALLVSKLGFGLAADVTFAGYLERVGEGSISIRLSDRRVVDALLPKTPELDATAVTARYQMGDLVQVTCARIQPVWEQATTRYQTLEVREIRLTSRPSPDDRAKLLGGVPFREGKNLLQRPDAVPPPPSNAPDASAAGGAELSHARRVNLEYAANMPNFVADEKAKRSRRAPGSSSWRDFDVVESEIAFRGNHAARQRIRRNGQPWEQPFEALPGFKWYEGFGTEITPLFDAQCPSAIEYKGRSKIGGRTVLDYDFTTPVDSCFPFFFFDYQRFNPARNGHFSVDDPDGHILRLDEQANGFPAEIEFSERQEHIAWDYVKIGEESHLLPVRANFLVRYYDGTQYRIEVTYKNHRHFEASTNITFH